MKNIKVAILGLGTVGGGVYRLIQNDRDEIEHKEGIRLEVKKVLAKQYAFDIPEAQKAQSIEEIVQDDEISVVIELMGGVEPAKSFILAALEKGKTVVSANKHLIARHWSEIESVAKEHDAGFYFEASVGGGIPIILAVRDGLQANTITSIYSIINGTTNYILTKMSEEGGSFDEVLAEAQALGYAEADPTSDVDGHDAANKLSILASMAFHSKVPLDRVYCEGIRGITSEDIQNAQALGYAIKLLAIGKKDGTKVEARVHPTMIPLTHPLASVRGSFNAVFLHGNNVDDLMFYGRGAGEMPTASAVVSDIIYAANLTSHRYSTFKNDYPLPSELQFEDNWLSAFYLRMQVEDKPGVLSQIAGIMSKYDVSISSVIQKGSGDNATILFITHTARENSVKNAIVEIKQLESVMEVANIIRVED
ncbi:MAG: homoserine dehydrogenase [Christensenellales bacterium]